MIITRTPHRISFFGGGTDYPAWYLANGGKVLGGAINKYCYLVVRELPPFFEHKHRIVYSKIEMPKTVDEIIHPAVREVLKYVDFREGISIHHDGDIPARSGMGSSSAFTVGLLKAVYAVLGKSVSKEELFRSAIHVEQNLIRENVGSQDQVFAACGGLNKVEFLRDGKIAVLPVVLGAAALCEFQKKFLLFFTGVSRNSSEIAEEQVKNISIKEKELRAMAELVDEGCSILAARRPAFADFGKLLNETWKIKRNLSSKISGPYIDEIYDAAMKNGAVGGKLLGAGGGGFMLFYAEPEYHARVRSALGRLLNIPFEFDFTGAEIIFNSSSGTSALAGAGA